MTGSATKQSIFSLVPAMDCFAPLAMTTLVHNDIGSACVSIEGSGSSWILASKPRSRL